MKAIVCEMCGSQDLVKQDGMYVCQNCGTKYDPEEAKKLMVEVKVNNSEKLKNWYQLARRAKDSNDSENAVKYYDLILQEEPKNWEAAFYSNYFRAMQTKIYYIASAAKSVQNNFITISPLLYEIESSPRKHALLDICLSVKYLAEVLESNARETFKSSVDNVSTGQMEYYNQYVERVNAIAEMCVSIASGAKGAFPNDPEIRNAYLVLSNMAIQYMINYNNIESLRQSWETNPIVKEIREIQPSYRIPSPDRAGFPSFYIAVLSTNERKNGGSGSSNNSAGGCYVATAVYGSYDCPQVWTLRRYRDYTLAETWFGRLFIILYYAISPTLVKCFGGTVWFKNMWKPKLDNLVKRLNEQGVADTPYQDRQW